MLKFNKIRLYCLYKFSWLYSDESFLEKIFPLRTGYPLNVENPQTFCEKLQWLKLYNRNPEYTKMVDKVEVKNYVAEIIGEKYIIPTLGVWNHAEEIDFARLPNQFVLKCSHDSGSVIVCKNKSKLDIRATIKELRRSLKKNYYSIKREWPYKNVTPRIIAEEYLNPAPDVLDLPDYKWYCFNGEPKFCQVIQDRTTNETIDFFDTEWNHQDFVGLNPAAGPAAVPPACPGNLSTHLEIARELSKNIPFARIDLYETGSQTFFGEITFYPLSGMGIFNPKEYDKILGKMITLSGEKIGG